MADPAVAAAPVLSDEEAAMGVTAVLLSTISSAAAAAAEAEAGGGPGGGSAWDKVKNAASSIAKAVTDAMAQMPTGRLGGGASGPTGSQDLVRDIYAQQGSDLPGTARRLAALAKAPAKTPAPTTTVGDITWANPALEITQNDVARRRLQDHAEMLTAMSMISAADPERAKQPDREITVLTVSGPEKITIRNPYKDKVVSERGPARERADGALVKENLQPLETLGVDKVLGFQSDSRLKVKLLEALWLCGSNANLADSPACLPIRVLTEIAETMKYGTAAKSHILAEKVLGVSYVGRWKSAVDRLVAKGAKPTEGASSAAGGAAALATASAAAAGAVSDVREGAERRDDPAAAAATGAAVGGSKPAARGAGDKPAIPARRSYRVRLPEAPKRLGGAVAVLDPPGRLGFKR